ncbi:MAG: C25 family cysteine peptidase [Gemmataceae bacterium]
MIGKTAWKLAVVGVVGLLCAALGAWPHGRLAVQGEPPGGAHDRTIFVAGKMTDVERIAFTATLAAANHPGVILFDDVGLRGQIARFVEGFGTGDVIPAGIIDRQNLESQLQRPVSGMTTVHRGRPIDLWQTHFPKAERVVICAAEPRRLLLHSAALAAAAHAPLFVLHSDEDAKDLSDRLRAWQTREVLAVGTTAEAGGVETITHYSDEEQVFAATIDQLARRGPVKTLVVANPADSGLSTIAPWIAAQKHAALLLTNDAGNDVNELVTAAIRQPALRQADNLLIVASRQFIPVEKRPNPLAGKDADIELEPLTPAGPTPFEFATGRLLDDIPAVALQLARQRLLKPGGPRKALVASNPGGGLPLLETVSRHSALELRNRGFDTFAMFGTGVNKDEVRRRLPDCDLFLWEGHHATLVKEYGFLEWDEPLKPSLVVLQSCLALTEEKALPVQRRGAIAVVGSSTRTYSASGGAFALAFLDALLYDEQTVGGALRQSKNFLLCYQLLKEKRLGPNVKLAGANLRASWAFTLWGDPTLKFPLPERDPAALAEVTHDVKTVSYRPGDDNAKFQTVILEVPQQAYDKVNSGKFTATMRPNTRLAGLLRGSDDGQQLVPFLFAEVALPMHDGETPYLKSRVPDDHWVFSWDARRRVGYLLLTPRAKDVGEIRFLVEWKS